MLKLTVTPLAPESSAVLTIDPTTPILPRLVGDGHVMHYNADDDFFDPRQIAVADIVVLSRCEHGWQASKLDFLEFVCDKHREYQILGFRAWRSLKDAYGTRVRQLLEFAPGRLRTLYFGALIEKPPCIQGPGAVTTPETFWSRAKETPRWALHGANHQLSSHSGFLAIAR